MKKNYKKIPIPALVIGAFFLLTQLLYAEIAPVKLDAKASLEDVRPGESFFISVRFTIPADQYLYAEETAVSAAPVSGLAFGKPLKPAPKKFVDPYVGTIQKYEGGIEIRLPVTVGDSVSPGPQKAEILVKYQGCQKNMCLPPKDTRLTVPFTILEKRASVEDKRVMSAVPLKTDENPFTSIAGRFGLIGVLAAAFAWGFLASLTPCVYPMIPVTISVIGAGSKGNALRGFLLSLFYVLGMSVTYAIFGVTAAWTGSLFGAYTGHPMVRIIIAGVFIILALGMFDIIYIRMPNAVSSRLGSGKVTGFLGVLLTGSAAGAVVGPCVAPMLVALLIYIAALGNKLVGFFVMWSFSLGMGMLFLLIGSFSGAASSIPKSGDWMEKLKQFFGVVMIAIALYYLKPLMPEAVFMLVTAVFLLGVGVFTGGFSRLSPDATKSDKIWKLFGILCLILGAGFALKFTLGTEVATKKAILEKTGIQWLSDETVALEKGINEKKPVMIDFSAEWCSACVQMDKKTFKDQKVIKETNRFVNLKFDCTNTNDPKIKEILKKYKIVGLPTILFIDSTGKSLEDLSVKSYVDAGELLSVMRKIK